MGSAVKHRTGYSASDLRRLAAASKHASQSRRLTGRPMPGKGPASR